MKIVVLPKKGKSRIVVGGVVILILVCVAGYIHFSNANLSARADRSNAMQVTKQVTTEQATPVAGPDFFTEYRLERERVRSERADLLRDIIKNAKNDESRQHAQDSVLKMAQEKERELEMENLIKARGFSDALVFIQDSSVSAVVKTPSLTREEVLQVADVISRVSGVKQEDITISAKP